jgi:hypothetical protein
VKPFSRRRKTVQDNQTDKKSGHICGVLLTENVHKQVQAHAERLERETGRYSQSDAIRSLILKGLQSLEGGGQS